MKWTEEETRLLRQHYPSKSQKEVAALLGRSHKAIASRAKLLGVRRIRQNYQKWTVAEDRVLRKLYPHRSTKEIGEKLGRRFYVVYQRAGKLGLKKTAAYMASPAACRLRRGDQVGRAYRFPKGHVPANKGARRPGWSPGRMASTQFKKGERAGAAQAKWVPIGTVKMNADGYLRRKIADEPEAIAGKGGHSTNWEFIHRRVWEDAHGPIPSGYRIWWKDGNRENCALENLQILSGADHMARTTIHNLPKPLKQVIQLTGALKRKIRNREKEQNGEKHAAGSAGSPLRDSRVTVG